MITPDQLEELNSLNKYQQHKIEELKKELDWAKRSEFQSPLIKNYYTTKLGMPQQTDGSLLGWLIFWLMLGSFLLGRTIC